MIILKLRGSLGNQLFSYCFARALSIKKQDAILIDKFPIYRYEAQSYYTLNRFHIKGFQLPFETKYVKSMYKLLGKFFSDIYAINTETLYDHEIEKLAVSSENIILDGHWQSYRYFQSEWNKFKKDLRIKDPLDSYRKDIASSMLDSDSVAVHIRRGDYIKVKSHNPLDMDYYVRADEMLREKIKKPNYFVFTDDIDWVRENFPFEKVTFVSQDIALPYKDLILMSTAKHNIIANSTFSWWGAWLNNNSEKMVFAPKKWFENKTLNSQLEDLVPSVWKII